MIDPDDERTALSRRKGVQAEPSAAPGVDDGPTLVSSRADDSSGAGLVTQAAATEPEPEPSGPRRRGPTASPDDAMTASRARPAGGRGAERRDDAAAGLMAVPLREGAPGAGRAARAPDAAPAPYRTRPVPSAGGVSRTAPPPRTPGRYIDTAAAEAASRRRSRRRAIAVGAAASVLLVGATVALAALLTAG